MIVINNPTDLQPFIEKIVTETITNLNATSDKIGEKLAFSEPEAAALLGLAQHQLRDERQRGRIGSTSIVGRKIRYTRSDLLAYLARTLHIPGKRAIYSAAAEKLLVVHNEVTQWLLTPGDGFLSDNPELFGSFIPNWINRHPKYRAAENALQNSEASIAQSESLVRSLNERREILLKQLDVKRARLFAI